MATKKQTIDINSFTSKEKEIEVVHALLSQDTYFRDELMSYGFCETDFFNIEENIKNDMPFFHSTPFETVAVNCRKLNDAYDKLRKEYGELKEEYRNRLSSLNTKFSELEEENEALILEMIKDGCGGELLNSLYSEEKIVKLKIDNNLPLSSKDLQFIRKAL